MKKKILLFLTLSLGVCFYSQDYQTSLAKEVCLKFEGINTKNKTQKEIEMAYGLAIFTSAMKYSTEIKRDFGIDIKKDIGKNQAMENLGLEVSILAAKECPGVFASLAEKVDFDTETPEQISEELINGEVVKVTKDNFIIFQVKGDNGILHKFYWVGEVESNIDLPTEYKKLKGKKVFISYYQRNIFDTKIDAYRTINEIIGLNIVDY